MCLWSNNTEINNSNARLTHEFEGRRDFDVDKGVLCMERIESHTLDAVLFRPEYCVGLAERAMVMKMDIEGSETKALLRASALLALGLAPCFIFFEFQRTLTETTGVDRHLIFDLLSAAGYRIYDCLHSGADSSKAYTRARWGGVTLGNMRADLHLPEANAQCRLVYGDGGSTPEPARTCTTDKIARISQTSPHTRSNCPNNRAWMATLLEETAALPSVTIVSMGCNTGNNFVSQMRDWSRDPRFSPSVYSVAQRQLAGAAQRACGGATAPTNAVCGLPRGVRGVCIKPMPATYCLLEQSMSA